MRLLLLYVWRPFPLNAWDLYRLFRSWGDSRRRAAWDAVRLAWCAARRWHEILREARS